MHFKFKCVGSNVGFRQSLPCERTFSRNEKKLPEDVLVSLELRTGASCDLKKKTI